MPRVPIRSLEESGPLAAWRTLRGAAAIGWFALVGWVALILIARRASGALDQPLGVAVLAGVGLLIAVAAGCTRFLARSCEPRNATQWASRLAWIPAVLIAAALSMRGIGFWGFFWLWAPVVVGEWLVWLPSRFSISSRVPAILTRPEQSKVVQTLERRRTVHGEEIVGQLRLDLTAGQRVAQAHVAFCPPLEQTPTIDVRQIEGPAARLRLAQAMAYGARFEVKLADDGPATIGLEFSATTPDIGAAQPGDGGE